MNRIKLNWITVSSFIIIVDHAVAEYSIFVDFITTCVGLYARSSGWLRPITEDIVSLHVLQRIDFVGLGMFAFA